MFYKVLNIIIISLTIVCTNASFRNRRFLSFPKNESLLGSTGKNGSERFLESTGETGIDFF
jgi:hypothetical protein